MTKKCFGQQDSSQKHNVRRILMRNSSQISTRKKGQMLSIFHQLLRCRIATYSGRHPSLEHRFRIFLLAFMEIPCPRPSLPWSSAQPSFSPHRELVRFVKLYRRLIVNSFELMEIPLVHIKLPIPYNRLFPMPIFIKPIVPPH